jgi:hypothetical protein
MGIRQRRQAPVVPGLMAVPGAKNSYGANLARTLRTRLWPRFALAGGVLAIVGVTVLSGGAQGGAVLGGIAVFAFAVLQGLGVHQRDAVDGQLGSDQMVLAGSSCVGSRHEPPVPAGGGGPGFAAR